MADEPKSNYPHLRLAQRAVWNDATGLSAPARSVGAYLLNRMSDAYDSAFPSISKIVSDTGFSRATVMRATKELVETGLFERATRPGYRGMHVYSVNDIGLLVTKITEYTDAEKARKSIRPVSQSNRSQGATGITEQPVSQSNRSQRATTTGITQQPVPVSQSDTEEDHRSDHRSDHSRDNGAGSSLPSKYPGANPFETAPATNQETPRPPSVQVAQATSYQQPTEHRVQRGDVSARGDGTGVELVNGLKVKWVELFGGDTQALEIALAGVSLQINSTTPWDAQIGRQLSRQAQDVRQRKQNYQAAVNRNSQNRGGYGGRGTPDGMPSIFK